MKYAISILQRKADQLDRVYNADIIDIKENAEHIRYNRDCKSELLKAIEKLKS